MRLVPLVLLALLAAAPIVDAQPKNPPATQKRSAGDAPAIELADAVAQARAYAAKHKLDLSKQYLQVASFDVVARKWDVVWQKPHAKGGSTEIAVHEDGKITVSHGD